MGDAGKPELLIHTPFGETNPKCLSPDGRWLAYTSNESGQAEVYVTPFPGPGRHWQISTDGGAWPVWRQDGEEIVYQGADAKLRAVAIRIQDDTLEVGNQATLFETTPGLSFSPTPDATKFLVITEGDAPPAGPLKLVTNWTAELEK